jgi:hypothetical protein
VSDLRAANQSAAAWCAEVNAAVHSEICAVPAGRLEQERLLLGPLPSLRPEIGARPASRKVDKLACVRFGSARYSVPSRLIGTTVLITVAETTIRILEPFTGEVAAEHQLVAPGEVSIADDHYGSSRPARPRRAPRPRTAAEKQFLALGEPAAAFLTGAAAAGVTNLPREIGEILTCRPRTATPRWRRRWSGPSSSAGGVPVTFAPSWPPAEPRRCPARPGRRWCSPCQRCRPGR